MLTVPVFPILVLQLASAAAGQNQQNHCASTPDYPLPICAQYIRPFADNAYWWENSCEIAPPADTSILMADEIETVSVYDYPCNAGYTKTCCAEIDNRCGLWANCTGPETAPPPPYYPQFLAPGWSSFQVCAVDNAARVLADAVVFYLPGNTPYTCTLQCGGYAYAGVEYGDECYCGSGLAGGAAPPAADVAECDMACAGDYTVSCGGPWRMQIYQNNVV